MWITRSCCKLESHLRDDGHWDIKCPIDFNAGKTQRCLSDPSNNFGTINIKMVRQLLMKSHLLRCWNCLSVLNWIGGFHGLWLKLHPRKWEPWFILWTFLCKVVLYLYKVTIQPCLEYYDHIWACTPNFHFDKLNKLQKRFCRVDNPKHRQNVASLKPFQ